MKVRRKCVHLFSFWRSSWLRSWLRIGAVESDEPDFKSFSCVTLGRSLQVSVLLSPHLLNGSSKGTYITGWSKMEWSNSQVAPGLALCRSLKHIRACYPDTSHHTGRIEYLYHVWVFFWLVMYKWICIIKKIESMEKCEEHKNCT